MLTPINIQLVSPADAGELLSLSRSTFYEAFEHLNNKADFEAYTSVAFTVEKLLREIENPDSEFYFALMGGQKVGYIKLNYHSAQTELQDENAMEIERIYVAATHQGKKIGNQLLDFAVSQAKAKQLLYIWLGVWEHNANAQRFYQRNGFKVFANHDFWVGNDKQADLLMRKNLGEP